MIAIEKYMAKLPDEVVQVAKELRRLNSVLQLACMYAPDHQHGGLYERRLRHAQTVFGGTVQLARALDRAFFDDLYVERQELRTILDILGGGNTLIVVIGRVGVGKTVLMQKLQRDILEDGSAHAVYFDFRTELSRFSAKGGRAFRQQVKDWIFSNVHDTVLSDELLKGWTRYRILYDKPSEGLRQQIESFLGLRLTTEQRVEKALGFDRVRELLLADACPPRLESLLAYLGARDVPLVLLFDNVDRRSLSDQMDVLSICNDIVDEFGLPVVLTIRTSNLGRMIREIREREGDESPLSRVFWTEDLESGPLGFQRPVRVEHMHPSSVRKTLERRFGFLRAHDMFDAYESYKRSLLDRHGLAPQEFEMRFWAVYEDITSEFVGTGMYQYSNYNLREMLVQYANFTTTIMFNPEREYCWERLMLSPTQVDRTRLKTYLIKWQIANGGIVPRRGESLINIYDTPRHILGLVDWRLLVYLYNHTHRPPRQRLRFADIAADFQLLGLDRDVLSARLLALAGTRGVHELGLVWLDCDKAAALDGDTIVELEPSGVYFVESLGTTREYAFWGALCADLQTDVVGRFFDLNDTYDDRFKLEVVFNLIDRVLVPGLGADLREWVRTMELPASWPGTKEEYFRQRFTKEGRYYTDHLIASVKATIDHSTLLEDDRKLFHRMYTRLEKAPRKTASSSL